MTREEAIKWLSDELMFLTRPNVNRGSGLEKKIAAYRMAIDALREQEERRWIPVSERLPESGQKVVFFNYGADAVYAGKFNYIGKRGTVWFRVGKTSYPGSHWMPLPEPPKEGA